MKISMRVVWYEHDKEFNPDYSKGHSIDIHGDSPKDCMNQYYALSENHDLAKYTPTQILYIY